ncbi:MAG: THUMP domain-containing protein [Candidatus Peribacteria bacterium]|nr:THUMP domain-containing protein [Candidatus Peribacteria bacterium]
MQKVENSKVDLHSPDYTLNIEIKDNKVFLVKNKYLGI